MGKKAEAVNVRLGNKKKEEGKCEEFLKMPSDDLAGDAKRRVPIPL